MSDKVQYLIHKGKGLSYSAEYFLNKYFMGFAGGTPEASGWTLGAGKAVGVVLPWTNELLFERAKHFVMMGDYRLNLGRGTQGVDGVLSSGRLVSFKGGDSRDITTAVEPFRAFVEAGGDVILYHLGGTFEPVAKGQTVAKPATDLTMRRISLSALVEAQGSETWEIGDRGDRFIFTRMDGKYPRLRVHWSAVPAHLWIDAQAIPFHGNDDLPGAVTWESVNAAPIAESAGVAVYDSGMVTVEGVRLAKSMRTGEAKLLAAIINANGEAVEAPNRQTPTTMKKKLGDASTRIETVRGKGYRWVA